MNNFIFGINLSTVAPILFICGPLVLTRVVESEGRKIFIKMTKPANQQISERRRYHGIIYGHRLVLSSALILFVAMCPGGVLYSILNSQSSIKSLHIDLVYFTFTFLFPILLVTYFLMTRWITNIVPDRESLKRRKYERSISNIIKEFGLNALGVIISAAVLSLVYYVLTAKENW